MERMYSVKSVAQLMDCCTDTARERMQEMEGVINIGTEKRRKLIIPESALQNYFSGKVVQEHRQSIRPQSIRGGRTLARMDRRTGELRNKK